jgi:hypothetical protein
MSLRTGCLIAVVVGWGSTAPVYAQVVVPNFYESVEGPGSSALPVHIQGNPWTFQLIVHENQLTSLVGKELTAISYRRSATEGGGYPIQTTSWAPYVIRLGPSVAPAAATGTFADNFSASPTQVRSGTLTVPPFAWPNQGVPGPNPFGPEISFDTPYLYTGGNLAMLITHPGSDNPNIGNALMDTAGTASPGRGTDFVYFAGQGFDVSSGSTSVFLPIVRFTAITPVTESETTLLAAGGALCAFAALRRFHRLRGYA